MSGGKLLSLTLFIALLLSISSARAQMIDFRLEAGNDNKSVDISWNLGNSPFTNLNIWKKVNSGDFTTIHTINSPDNAGSFSIDTLDLTENVYYFFLHGNIDGNNIISDTLCAIYLSLGTSWNYNPLLHVPNYPEDLLSSLWFYRKYHYQADFVRIHPSPENSGGRSYIDSIAAVCGDTVKYYLKDKSNRSFSATKAEEYEEKNPPKKPEVKGISVDEDGNLSISWDKSPSTDVEFYRIDSIMPLIGTWQVKDIVSAEQNTYILFPNFCNSNEMFSVRFRLLAIDSCGNSSISQEGDTLSPLLFNAPYLDECNTLTFTWNDAHYIRGNELDHKFIFHPADNQSDDIIFDIPENRLIITNDTVIFKYDFPEEYNGEYECRLMIINDHEPADTIYSCSHFIEITSLSTPPEHLCIYSVSYDEAIQHNIIKAHIDPNPANVEEYILYTAPRKTRSSDISSHADTIEIIKKERFPLDSAYYQFTDTAHVTGPYKYYLVAKNICGNSFQDSSYFKSIYLLGSENSDTQLMRLCFSKAESYLEEEPGNDFEYVIVRSYSGTGFNSNTNEYLAWWKNCNYGPVGSDSFCSYCHSNNVNNYCDDDLYSYYSSKSFSIKWVIEGSIEHEGLSAISRSNPVSLAPSLVMPNAFIVGDVNNDINARFGPMNYEYSSNPSPMITEYNFKIFNSWGEMIWQSDDAVSSPRTFYWYGIMSKTGNLAPAGVYFYSISIKFESGLLLEKSGTVTLFRH